MRILAMPVCLLLAFAAPAAAETGEAAPGYPEAAVRAIYATILSEDWAAYDASAPGLPMTPRLAALFDAERAYAAANDDVGRIDFDWAVNAQDVELSELAVESRAVPPRTAAEPERAVVAATFRNFDRPTEVDWYWERGADGGWRLDDVVGGDPQGETYTLSLLLGYGF